MNTFVEYNPHPKQADVGDCVKRAFTKVTGLDYMEVQRQLNRLKRELKQDAFNSDKTWRTYLERNGFVLVSFPAIKGKSRMTVKKLAESSPNTTWVCRCAGHLVAIVDGHYYDSWDSGDKCVYQAYKKVT